MKKIFLLVASIAPLISLTVTLIVAIPHASATMCGAGNTGSCQIACNAGQSPIGDPTNACSGTAAGGTVCCSPASIQEYPAAQCQAMNGSMGTLGDITCSSFSNHYSAGKYLNSACQVIGECCVPSGTPFQAATACSVASCTATPGQRCTSGITDTCTFEEQLVSDTCPNSASKCCKLLPSCSSQGGSCYPGACPVGFGTTPASGCAQSGQCCKQFPPGSGSGSGSGTAGPTSLQYTLLEQIPGSNNWQGDLPSYLKNLYNFAFWAIGIAALLMITVGGFLYATSAGNTARMGTAKTIIFDSLLGIVIALLAWLFLYVINPDLVKIKLPTVTSPTPGPSVPSGPGPQPPSTGSSVAEQVEKNSNIQLATNGSCKESSVAWVTPALTIAQMKNTGTATRCFNGCNQASAFCTEKTVVSEALLKGMLQVAQQYPYTVTSITGGSHSQNSSHYAGRAIDVSVNGDKKTQWPAVLQAFRAAGASFAKCERPNGTFTPDNDCTGADHIHIAF